MHKLIFIFSFLIIGINIYSQTKISIVSDSIFKEIKSKKLGQNWIQDSITREITWKLVDTFLFEFWCCEPYERLSKYFNTKDSIILKLRFEENWDSLRYKKQFYLNNTIIDTLRPYFIRYGDSVKWRIKVNKESFLNNSYTELNGRRFGKVGNYNINNVVRLPDCITENIGIYFESIPNLERRLIHQENLAAIVDKQIRFISIEILKSKKIIDFSFKYK